MKFAAIAFVGYLVIQGFNGIELTKQAAEHQNAHAAQIERALNAQ